MQAITRYATKVLRGAVKPTKRGHWSGKFDSLLANIGFAVGLGNIWSFPHICYSNGGGAFLIPYIIMMVLVGLPIVFLEMSFGQYTNMGLVHGWKSCPIMSGVGWATCFTSASITVYYNVILSWAFYYLFASLTANLPWQNCKNSWNDNKCFAGSSLNKFSGPPPCSETVTVNCTSYETPTTQYYQRVVLGFVSYDGILRKMTDPIGQLQWHISLCLLLCWFIVFVSLIKGIKTTGKIVYFTVICPYVALIILAIRGMTLPGAADGIAKFFTPDFKRLVESKVWTAATKQVFFSLGIGLGGFMTLASYNDFKNNCYRDALIVCTLDFLTSLISGVAVFSVIGYMARLTGKPFASVVQSGSGLAFIVYTEAVTTMPAGPLWSTVFFVMAITLGIDSQFVMLEIVLTNILDQWPWLRSDLRKDVGSKAAVCTLLFLFGLPMCCKGGIYLFDVFETYATGYNMYVIAVAEIIGICAFYGAKNFINDVKIMLGFEPGCYWTVCWTIISPALILFIFGFSIVTYKRPIAADGEPMADWGEALGWSLMLISMLIIVAFSFMWQPVVVIGETSVQLQQRVLRAIAFIPEQRNTRVSDDVDVDNDTIDVR